MADAILLSQEMFDRMKKMLDDYEKGYADSIQLGALLELEERGTGYMKFRATNQATNLSGLRVTNGTVNVSSVNIISLDPYLFKLTGTSGTANITLNTTNCN